MSDLMMVAGAGRSGIAAAKMILSLGGSVLLYDSNDALDIKEIKEKFDNNDRLRVKKGKLLSSDVAGVNICVISPGIPLNAPFVKVLDEAEIPIWSEIQLAYQMEKGTLCAITGTNGKTTTTTLTGYILERAFDDVFTLGNIGTAYTSKVLETSSDSYTVLEVSSFQLETITDFRPHISAILNITPDHLNRHGSMENYISIKEDIAVNQTKDDICVLNYDDPVLKEYGETKCPAKVIWFSYSEEPEEGCYYKDEAVYYKNNKTSREIIKLSDIKILGRHNIENVMAAICIAEQLDVSDNIIYEACRDFNGVEHRIEYVETRTGVKYYNDSKATNPDAAIKGIEAMQGPTIIIAGGYDKGNTYDEWIESFNGKVKYLILIGATKRAIEACAKAHGFTNIMFAENMSEAVRVSAVYADMGDNVLLSPACASWDMYESYEQRGRDFKECVRNL